MQLKFFSIPIPAGEAAADDLNRFLATHSILGLDRQLVQAGAASCWAVAVAYDAGGEGRPQGGAAAGRRGKVDYREVLSEADFGVYARLRTLRKTLADAEGTPAYNLFTNDQLAEMVTRRVGTAAALREIPGVGEGRAEKYGAAFLEVLTEALSAPAPAAAQAPKGAA